MGKHELKGVRLFLDETEGKRYVQIDLDTLASEPEAVQDHLDGLITETRRHESTVSHDTVMRSLEDRAARK